MKVGITSDHRGYEIKEKVIEYLKDNNYEVIDLGTNSPARVDFPDFGIALGEKLIAGEYELGIAFCGTGIGMSIAANKVLGIRCAKVDNKDEARLARQHNNANIVAINSTKSYEEIIELVDIFLTTDFLNMERYNLRNKKILDYEKGKYNNEC